MAKKYSYQEMKDKARQIAIDWQNEQSDISLSWEGVAIACAYFERLGKRFGLIREFRENGII